MSTIRIDLQPAFRPYLVLGIVILLMSAFDTGQGRFLTIATAFSALQSFGSGLSGGLGAVAEVSIGPQPAAPRGGVAGILTGI